MNERKPYQSGANPGVPALRNTRLSPALHRHSSFWPENSVRLSLSKEAILVVPQSRRSRERKRLKNGGCVMRYGDSTKVGCGSTALSLGVLGASGWIQPLTRRPARIAPVEFPLAFLASLARIQTRFS
jgi:hypothetical protein